MAKCLSVSLNRFEFVSLLRNHRRDICLQPGLPIPKSLFFQPAFSAALQIQKCPRCSVSNPLHTGEGPRPINPIGSRGVLAWCRKGRDLDPIATEHWILLSTISNSPPFRTLRARSWNGPLGGESRQIPLLPDALPTLPLGHPSCPIPNDTSSKGNWF